MELKDGRFSIKDTEIIHSTLILKYFGLLKEFEICIKKNN